MSTLPPPPPPDQRPGPPPVGPPPVGLPPVGLPPPQPPTQASRAAMAPPKWWARKVLGLPAGGWLAIGAAALVGIVAVVSGGDGEKNTIAPGTTPVATTAEPTGDTTEPTLTTPATDPQPDETAEGTEPTEAPVTDPLDGSAEVAGSPPGTTGDRERPVPTAELADIGGGWRLQVLEVVADGTALVAAEYEYNEPPPAGSAFTLVKVALGYFGVEDPTSGFEPTITGVGATSSELDTDCGLVPDQLDYFTDVFAGGVLVGNLCFVTTPDDRAALQLYALGDFFSEEGVFLDASAGPPAATPMATMVGPQAGAAATPRRLDPTPLATPVDLGEGWTMTVTGPARDITDAAMAENQFNEPPPDGFRFIGVDVVYAFDGVGSSAAYNVTTKAVGDMNVELRNDCGVFPGEIDTFLDLFAGGSVTGTICFVIPSDEAQFVLYASADFAELPTVFAVS